MYCQRLAVPLTRALVARAAIGAESALATRCLHTTVARKDIDSAAKYIGAGAATVGVAGSVSFTSPHFKRTFVYSCLNILGSWYRKRLWCSCHRLCS